MPLWVSCWMTAQSKSIAPKKDPNQLQNIKGRHAHSLCQLHDKYTWFQPILGCSSHKQFLSYAWQRWQDPQRHRRHIFVKLNGWDQMRFQGHYKLAETSSLQKHQDSVLICVCTPCKICVSCLQTIQEHHENIDGLRSSISIPLLPSWNILYSLHVTSTLLLYTDAQATRGINCKLLAQAIKSY